MAIARTTFSLSEVAERWTRLYGEKWTESAVLRQAKAHRLLVGIELPCFQGILGTPVDSIETQEQLDLLLIGAVAETGKDYLKTSLIPTPSSVSGFFWIRSYQALLSIEFGESLRRVVELERVLINRYCAVCPIIESVRDITISTQNIIIDLQEIERLENDQAAKISADDRTPLQERIEIIVQELGKHHPDLLALPFGAKVRLCEQLCKEQPQLFTESTFEKAWTAGTSCEIPRFRLTKAERFRPR